MKNEYEFNENSVFIKKPTAKNFKTILWILIPLVIFFLYLAISILRSDAKSLNYRVIAVIIVTLIFGLVSFLTTFNLYRDRDVQIRKTLNLISINKETYSITNGTKVLIKEVAHQYVVTFNFYLYLDKDKKVKLAHGLDKDEMIFLKDNITKTLGLNFMVKESYFW